MSVRKIVQKIRLSEPVFFAVFFLALFLPFFLKLAFTGRIGPEFIFFFYFAWAPLVSLKLSLIRGTKQLLIMAINLLVAAALIFYNYPNDPMMDFKRQLVHVGHWFVSGAIGFGFSFQALFTNSRRISAAFVKGFAFFLLIPFFGGCASQSAKPTLIGPSLANSTGKINSEMTFREVAEDTYVVNDKAFFNSNVLVAAMPDGAVLIASSPMETQNANALVDWIIEKFSPNRIVAINTHFHSDGTGGNDAFNKAGVETWASEETQKLHQEFGEAMRNDQVAMFKSPSLKRRIRARKEVPAQHTFKQQEGLDLNFGPEQVRVMYPGPAHSPDNVVVYLPRRSVLFGGCMIRSLDSKDLGYIGRADIERWPQSARNLLPLPLHVVVPGHGSVGGPELIQKTISLATEAQLKTEEKL